MQALSAPFWGPYMLAAPWGPAEGIGHVAHGNKLALRKRGLQASEIDMRHLGQRCAHRRQLTAAFIQKSGAQSTHQPQPYVMGGAAA